MQPGRRFSFLKSRLSLFVLACLATGGVVTIAVLSASGSGAHTSGLAIAIKQSAAVSALRDGSTAKFHYLAGQRSNRCDLEPNALTAMPDSKRLQGSCCTPMNLAAYRSQVRGLRAYGGMAEIPPDPYDVRVSLAKRLLSYDRSVPLSAEQARTYRRAMQMSDEKGPCCCRCWRWYAFRGLSKHLIVDRDWRPAQIARVIDLVEGCGGPADHS